MAAVLAAALTEIYLCGVCSRQEMLRRNGCGQGWGIFSDYGLRQEAGWFVAGNVTGAVCPTSVFFHSNCLFFRKVPRLRKISFEDEI